MAASLRRCGLPAWPADRSKRRAAWLTLALLLVGFGRAFDRDETAVAVQVSSADHEREQGYFSLGDNVTVMVKRAATCTGFSRGSAGTQ